MENNSGLELGGCAARDAAMSHAAALLTQEAQCRWGNERVHVSGTDPMESLAVLTIGPDIYQAVGPRTARNLAREATVFGGGIAHAMADEAAKSDGASLVGRATNNASMGAGMAVLTELQPLIGGAIATGMSLSWLYQELGPPAARRNALLGDVWQKTWRDQSNSNLRSNGGLVGDAIGGGAFETAFDTATGGLGYAGSRRIFSGRLPEITPSSLATACAELKAAGSASLTRITELLPQSAMQPAFAVDHGFSDRLHMSQVADTDTRQRHLGGMLRTSLIPDAIAKHLTLEERAVYVEAVKQQALIDLTGGLDARSRQVFKTAYTRAFVELHRSCGGGDSRQIAVSADKLRTINASLELYLRDSDLKPLPPGVHEFKLGEMEKNFAFNDCRRELFGNIVRLADHLANAGCKNLYIGGSFITKKELPGDFDACWDPASVDFAKVSPTLLDSALTRNQEFGGDIFMMEPSKFNHFRQMQLDRKGDAKGIVRINLENLHAN